MGDMSFSGGFETLEAGEDKEGWIQVVSPPLCQIHHRLSSIAAFDRGSVCWKYDPPLVSCEFATLTIVQFSGRYRGCGTSLHGFRSLALSSHFNRYTNLLESCHDLSSPFPPVSLLVKRSP